jgi:hypothetical protein
MSLLPGPESSRIQDGTAKDDSYDRLLQYSSVNLDGFTERGSLLPLNIHSESEESLRSDLGSEFPTNGRSGRFCCDLP